MSKLYYNIYQGFSSIIKVYNGDHLVWQGVDKSSLKRMIISNEYVDKYKYTEESYKDLEEELKKAKEIYDNPSASQEEVDNAKKNLTQAYVNLTIVSKVELNRLIEKYGNLDKERYTEDSFNAFDEH